MERGSYMKRILPLFLILVLVGLQLLSFTTVAYAASDYWSENGAYINVLDYATVNDSGNYSFTVDGSFDANFTLPYEGIFKQFDILVSADSFVNAEIYYSGYDQSSSLTKSIISGNLIRFYGFGLDVSKKTLTIRFTSSSPSTVSFKSFFVSNISPDRVRTGYELDIYSASPLVSGSSNTGQRLDLVVNSSAAVGNRWFTANLFVDQWYKFDFIEFTFFANVHSINSISANIANSYGIDPLITYLANDNTVDGNRYVINVKLDISRVPKTYYDLSNGAPLNFILQGELTSSTDGLNSGSNQFSVLGLLGGFFINYPDPYISWLTKLHDQMGQIFASSGVGESIKQESQNQSNKIDTALGGLESEDPPDISSIQDAMDYTGIISPDIISNSTTFLMAMFDVPLIYKISMLGLMFALVATVLFGKR